MRKGNINVLFGFNYISIEYNKMFILKLCFKLRGPNIEMLPAPLFRAQSRIVLQKDKECQP